MAVVEDVDFSTLDGRRFILDAVDTYPSLPTNTNGLRFRLDGVVYCAEEDPDDGYRSLLRRLGRQDTNEITNVFSPGCQVIARLRPEYDSKVLDLLNQYTKTMVLRVGTDYTDDYYPQCILSWCPEEMHANSKEVLRVESHIRIIKVRPRTPREELKPISKPKRVRLTKNLK